MLAQCAYRMKRCQICHLLRKARSSAGTVRSSLQVTSTFQNHVIFVFCANLFKYDPLLDKLCLYTKLDHFNSRWNGSDDPGLNYSKPHPDVFLFIYLFIFLSPTVYQTIWNYETVWTFQDEKKNCNFILQGTPMLLKTTVSDGSDSSDCLLTTVMTVQYRSRTIQDLTVQSSRDRTIRLVRSGPKC